MAYELVWEDNGVYWKYRGNITGDEIIDASTSIYGDARFITLKYKFADFTEVEDFEMDKRQLALIAYQHLAAERSNPYLKNVILIKPGHKITQMAHEFATYFNKSSWEVKVYTDLDEANQWAGR